tara:strand:- start:499 stop:639 length:141 start_codon:yes stop_codon:yes gene_type:complete
MQYSTAKMNDKSLKLDRDWLILKPNGFYGFLIKFSNKNPYKYAASI